MVSWRLRKGIHTALVRLCISPGGRQNCVKVNTTETIMVGASTSCNVCASMDLVKCTLQVRRLLEGLVAVGRQVKVKSFEG
jgi:hypothetical protein